MKSPKPTIPQLLIFSILTAVAMLYFSCASDTTAYTLANRMPSIDPDYSGIVVPPSIAPLNFTVEEAGTRYVVKIYSDRGDTIKISSDNPNIDIPIKQWKKLLESNRGGNLHFDIRVRAENGEWKAFDTITSRISDDDIDRYLIYRRIKPLYNFWRDINIHQRDLTCFKESLVFSNRGIETGCCNCHTLLNNDPRSMLMHTRSSLGVAMLLVRDGDVRGVNSRTPFGAPIAYSSWHPSGKLIAFSVNRVKQYFHSTGGEVRDVVDLDSSLGIYSVESNSIIDASPMISMRDRLETYPMWSPDGRYLYYCSTNLPWTDAEKDVYDKDVTIPEDFKEIRYDLMRIRYDIESDSWGEAEVVLSSDVTGKSITQPKLSPDGRFLLFCMADYGCFPVYQPGSDLYMMNLESGDYAPLAGNSDRSDSWHSWSTNSRWIVFSSKRINGVTARPYLCHVDPDGTTSKPILLPQKDPEFYDTFLDTFNVPEFMVSPVTTKKRAFYAANGNLSGIEGIDIAVTAATPQAPAPSGQER